MQIERREFLKLIGGLSGGVALWTTGLDELFEVPDALVDRLRTGPGIESWKTTVCGQCPGGCGVRVRLIDGVPVYVKGNRHHPINKGGMCPLGHGAIEALFNPDRIKGPMTRIGPVGFGRWEPLTWDAALERVVGRLSNLRQAGTPHRVAFLGSTERGLMREHIARFMQAFGSPNYYQISGAASEATAMRLATGQRVLPAPDLANARLVVSFGSNYLEEGYSPVYYTKLRGLLHSRENGARTRFVQIEPRMGLTAAKADRWIPIRPGTYGALALGIAHILIREAAYDRDFVREHTFGFESWADASGDRHTGFKDLVLAEYYPERVADITGVTSTTIVELAHELQGTRPCIVIGGEGVTDNTNGTYAQLAVNSLNALLGNFGAAGGLVFPSPTPFAIPTAVEQDPIAQQGIAAGRVAPVQDNVSPATEFSIERLFQNLATGDPYPIDVLFMYGGNPVFQLPGHQTLRMALERIPLVVSFDSFMTETSEYAHLILPEHTFLERWDEVSDVPTVAFSHVSIRQPVIDPLHDTRHAGDVLIDVGKAVANHVGEALGADTFDELLKNRLRGVFESEQGLVASDPQPEAWFAALQGGTHARGSYASFSSFWRDVVEKGAWWNPNRSPLNPARFFRTPSGRYEFYLQAHGSGSATPQARATVPGPVGDEPFLPHHEPVPSSDEGPLYLISFQTLANRDGFGANQPMMQEMFGQQVHYFWQTWVEIHPTTAELFGISDDDWVWIQSVVGSIRVRTKVHPGIIPGVLAVPFGQGHTSYGRYARGHGANPHEIMKALYDPVSQRPALQATRVHVTRTT